MKKKGRDIDQFLAGTPCASNGEKPPAWVWVSIFTLLALLSIVDLLSDGHYGGIHWESIPVFFVLYGFLSCLALVVVAKLWSILLGRNEDYYE